MYRYYPLSVFVFCVTQALSAVNAQIEFPVSFYYEPDTGGLRYEAAVGVPVHAVELVSSSGMFVGPVAPGVTDQNEKLVHVLTNLRVRPDTPVFDFGPLLPRNLTFDALAKDLCVEVYSQTNLQTGYAPISLNGQMWMNEFRDCSYVRPPQIPPADPRAVLYYKSQNGNLRVDVSQAADSPSKAKVSALEIHSRNRRFTGAPAMNLGGIFDVDRDALLFKLFPSGFEDVDFGDVMQTGLTNSQFVNDVCVNGAWSHGGSVVAEYQYPDAGLVPIPCGPVNAEPTDLEMSYDPTNGEFAVSADSLEVDPIGAMGGRLSTLDIRSASGVFTGKFVLGLNGPNDIVTDHRILKQDRDGFTDISFGPILTRGLSLEFLRADLTFDATLLDGSLLGDVRAVAVPEPSIPVAFFGIVLFLLRHGTYIRKSGRSETNGGGP